MPYPALRRPVLALCSAALACGTAMSTAAPAAHAADHRAKPKADGTTDRRNTPPPAHMSTVGGELLGDPGTQVHLLSGAPDLPGKITARSWIVADAETGDVLASHNAHWELAPASTLKMLFADTVLPKFPKSEEHEVTEADLRDVGEGSSLVGIKENHPYTVHDLWLGVFLRSGNDAVHVLSSMNGGIDRTVAEMNAKAEELRADDTHVVSPDGYDMPGQVSSAYDLTLFAREGLQNADFREYCSTVTAEFPGDWVKDKDGHPTQQRESFGIQNTNRLLSGESGLPPYRGIAGVKNGNTTNAGATFTGVAQRDGRTLLVTVMDPEPEHDLVYKEAASLLDWGFEAAGDVKPVGILVPPKSALRASDPPAQGAGKLKAHANAGTTASTSPGGDGLWTAAAVGASSLTLLAALALLVHRRWPLPLPSLPNLPGLPNLPKLPGLPGTRSSAGRAIEEASKQTESAKSRTESDEE